MKYFLITLLCLIALLGLSYGINWIYVKFLNLRLKLKKRKRAKLEYELVKLSYDSLLLMRQTYHLAKFLDDESEKQKIQSNCIRIYNNSLKTLSDSSNSEYKEYLKPKEKEDLEKTLALPRYKLF